MDIKLAKFNMVEQQIRPWNVFDENVLSTLAAIPRDKFVQEQYQSIAFSDVEIPLPNSQKMLFPRIEARLMQALDLQPTDKVLEIGTGSGYVTAVLAKLTDFVYSVEIDDINRQFAVQNLTKAGIKNVSVVSGDGQAGLSSKEPFNKILVGCGLSEVSHELKSQLTIGGKLVAIIGNDYIMEAILITRDSQDSFSQTKLFETQLDKIVQPHSFTL
jgi:protein-L-isoaspartate(D-aspartate) O-methyltransferase